VDTLAFLENLLFVLLSVETGRRSPKKTVMMGTQQRLSIMLAALTVLQRLIGRVQEEA
jgi:hypothetical protein